MANGPLSSVMVIASSGLVQNQGLAVASNLTTSINTYTSTTEVSDFVTVFNLADGILANTTLANLALTGTTSSDPCPALTNSVSANLASTYPAELLTDVALAKANLYIGGGDLGKFAQVYNQCQGYRYTTNQMINSSVNSQQLDLTFTDMDSLTTGGVSSVSNNFPKFGADLKKLGVTINLSRIQYLGRPWALLAQTLNEGGMLPGLYDALIMNNVTNADIGSVTDTNPSIAASLDKQLYKSMQLVTGTNLDQVKTLLEVTTVGLTSMADLLNPVKMLPDSYQSLVVQLPTGQGTGPAATKTVSIYLANGSVNSEVLQFFATNSTWQELSTIIPPDQAAANLAWARSLAQVKNVLNITLPDLATSTLALESNSGLGDINALTTPVPQSIRDSIQTTMATGTGPNGTLTICDFIGTVAGVPWGNVLPEVTGNINALANLGAFTNLYTTWSVMLNTLNGVYGNVGNTITIPSGPGAGTYSNANVAFDAGLIPAAQGYITTVVSTYPTETSNLNTSWGRLTQQIEVETTNLGLAQVNFATLEPNSRSAIQSIVYSLHDIGTDIAPGGPNDLFTGIADTSNITGQAVIASLREGRNIQALGDAGVGTDTQLNAK